MLSLTGSTGARNGHAHSCCHTMGSTFFWMWRSWFVARLAPGVRAVGVAMVAGNGEAAELSANSCVRGMHAVRAR